MTLPDAMAAHGPAWLQYWMYILMIGGFILPLALLIWKQTRITAVIAIASGVLSAVGVGYLYDTMGYVKLLGLPHILFWTPLVWWLVLQIRRPDMPDAPRYIMIAISAVIVVSLAFDYVDVLRWIAGNRTPLAMPPT